MNREIKFRIYDFEYKKMIYPTDGYAPVNYFALGCNDIVKSRLSYKHELMQFIGLKDKNGVEIYDGDILRNNANEETIVEYTIKFIQNCGCCNEVNAIGYDFSDFWNGITEIEIIGNIYENPELLK